MTTLQEVFFTVAFKYNGEVIEVNRADGNPFPYATKAAARRVANQQQAITRKMTAPVDLPLVDDAGNVEVIKADPRGFRFFVRDWLSLREIA